MLPVSDISIKLENSKKCWLEDTGDAASPEEVTFEMVLKVVLASERMKLLLVHNQHRGKPQE